MNVTINEYDKLKLYDQLKCVDHIMQSGIIHVFFNTNIECTLNDIHLLPNVLNHIIYEYVHDFLLISYTIRKEDDIIEMNLRMIHGLVDNLSINFDYTIHIGDIICVVAKNNEYNNKFIIHEALINQHQYYYDTISFFNYYMKLRYDIENFINVAYDDHVTYKSNCNMIDSISLSFPFLDTRRIIINDQILTLVIIVIKNIV